MAKRPTLAEQEINFDEAFKALKAMKAAQAKAKRQQKESGEAPVVEPKKVGGRDVTKAIQMFRQAQKANEQTQKFILDALALLEGNATTQDSESPEGRSPEYVANLTAFPRVEGPFYGRNSDGKPRKPNGRHSTPANHEVFKKLYPALYQDATPATTTKATPATTTKATPATTTKATETKPAATLAGMNPTPVQMAEAIKDKVAKDNAPKEVGNLAALSGLNVADAAKKAAEENTKAPLKTANLLSGPLTIPKPQEKK